MTLEGEFVDVPMEFADKVIGNYNPTVIITTKDRQGRSNAAPFAMFMAVCHNPPLVTFSVGEGKDTLHNVQETGEFVVNVPGREILKQMMVTAKRLPPGVNELAEAGLQEMPGNKINVSRIKECKLHIECRVEWIKEAGDHYIVLGKVLSVSGERKIFDERFRLKMEELRPVHYLGRGTDTFFELGESIQARRV